MFTVESSRLNNAIRINQSIIFLPTKEEKKIENLKKENDELKKSLDSILRRLESLECSTITKGEKCS